MHVKEEEDVATNVKWMAGRGGRGVSLPVICEDKLPCMICLKMSSNSNSNIAKVSKPEGTTLCTVTFKCKQSANVWNDNHDPL